MRRNLIRINEFQFAEPIKQQKSNREFLTQEELKLLIDHQDFRANDNVFTRLAFLFQCFIRITFLYAEIVGSSGLRQC
jgi:hypothetical protein